MASFSSSSTADFPASFYCSSNSMSAQVHPRKYLVFINFRGKDTREGFVSILYEKLEQRGILAYLDSVELDKGAEIKTIIGAIQDSNIAVVVFSNEYATSPYCLDELVKIMDCRENTGLQVLVVFYRVTPENVENLEDEEDLENPNKSFAKAFVTHKKSCDEETIVKWKTALKKATSVGGWDKASKDIRNEDDLANKIVEDILEKRMHIYFRVDLKGLVGMRRRVEDIESLLFGEKVNDVRIVGIWGMGGIGKTTLARAIFDKYSFHFQSGCFLENVRAASNNLGLLRELKDELLAGLLNRANKSIRTSTSSSNFSMDQLRHKKETGAIEGISLDLAKLRKSVCMSPTVFSKMDQLKLLRFRCGDKLNFPRGLESLPRELRYLRWDHYPLEALPSKVYFENQVELDMRHGKIERFWTRKQNLSGLRVMRVHWVFSLIEMPDFSGALNLQIIDFQDCSNLLEISSSIKYLKNLKELNVTHCTKIKSVPSTKGLPSLGKLILRDCSALENLSEVSENIEELDLCGTGIKEVPSCSQLTSLRKLNLLKCRNLQKFPEISTSVEELSMGESKIILEPHMIKGLSRIQTLRLTGQKVLGKIRHVLGRLSSLRDLDLSSGNFKFIPASIKNLSCLQFLGLHRCRRLQLLPELPPHLIRLNAAGCKSLEVVKHSRFEIVGTLERLPDFRVNFSFFACGKLNEKARRNVLIHAQQRIRLLAREPLYQLSKGVGRKDEVRFVYPGSEIPDWIDLQSNGNSITVELPPNLLDGNNFLGFVISAVVVFPISRVFVQCHFESISAARNLKLDVEMLASSDSFPSTHVALWYSSSLHQAIVSSFKEEDYYKKATFCFSESIIGGRIFGVTNCGVRLLRIGDGEE